MAGGNSLKTDAGAAGKAAPAKNGTGPIRRPFYPRVFCGLAAASRRLAFRHRDVHRKSVPASSAMRLLWSSLIVVE